MASECQLLDADSRVATHKLNSEIMHSDWDAHLGGGPAEDGAGLQQGARQCSAQRAFRGDPDRFVQDTGWLCGPGPETGDC